MQSLLYVTILAGATLFWGYIFYKKDYHPQPIKVLLQIFGIGLFAMLPVFAYKYIYQNYLPIISEFEIFRPLLDHGLLTGFTLFLFNLILLTIILLTVTGLMTVIFTLFRKDTALNIRSALKKIDELELIPVSVMIGLLIYLEKISEGIFNVPIVQGVIGSILFLTIIEEYIKHLIVRFVDDKKLRDIDDAITLSVMVGLAFATSETLIYAISAGDLSLIIYRSFLTLPIHLVASGIFGYYYGLAHFAKPITAVTGGDQTYKVPTGLIGKVFKFKRSQLYEEEKMSKGLLLATLFHGTANILFELNLAFIVVPIIVLGLVLLSYMYKEGHTMYRLLRAH